MQAELERRLFAKPVGTWTADDWAAFFATAQRLVDEYGKERVLVMVNELVLVDAGPTRDYQPTGTPRGPKRNSSEPKSRFGTIPMS